MKAIVNMACGLANRMFQYSFYLYLHKAGWDVSIDYTRKAKLPHESVDWEQIFPNATFTEASKFKVFLLGGGSNLISKLRRRFTPRATRVINMPSAFSYDLPKIDESYIIGVFQSAAMIENIDIEVHKAFEFKPFSNGRNKELMDEIKSCNSVGIHIRKGNDYCSRIWYQNTCSPDYYKKAIKEISKHIESPKFYVFTDNPKWVKDNLSDIDYTLVQNNPTVGWGSHFDMQLMSYCHHNIISNSTYSWWGAYLNQNEDKIVVCPNAWFNPNSCKDWTSKSILCSKWIAI